MAGKPWFLPSELVAGSTCNLGQYNPEQEGQGLIVSKLGCSPATLQIEVSDVAANIDRCHLPEKDTLEDPCLVVNIQ